MKKIYILTAVFALLVFSCLEEPGDYREKSFWATNFSTGNDYRLTAELLAENSRCEVWVEKGSGVSAATANAVASEYSGSIYVKLMDVFGWTANYNGGTINTMQYADRVLGDGNGKLTILLLDIKDNYKTDGSYVAGYFWMGNFFNVTGSNQCDMIYVDVNPSKVGSKESYKTFAHEMQHLMNFATTYAFRTTDSAWNSLDLWIDEGLSSAAEWVYSGEIDKNRINWYNADKTTLISQGDNFYIWDNYSGINPNAILNDYATVNLFFQWLRLQTGIRKTSLNISNNEAAIFFKIITSPKDKLNYTAITNLMENSSWQALMQNWHEANFINHASSTNGYKNKINVKQKYLNSNNTIKPLYPGEAVYSYTQSALSKTGNANIQYVNLPSANALLTHNVNTGSYNSSTGKTEGSTASGEISGITPPPANIQPSIVDGRSIGYQDQESYQIDAGDMLRRIGSGRSFFESVQPVSNNQSRNAASSDFKITGELMRYSEFPNE